MLVTVPTGLTYILREPVECHLFVVSIRSYRERETIFKNADLLFFFFTEKEEHEHLFSDAYIHGPALFSPRIKPRMPGAGRV